MKATILIAVLLWSASSAAQVNTEKLRGDHALGVHGHVDGAMALKTGNAPRLTITSGARLGYRWEEVHYVFLQGQVKYGEKGSDHDRYLNRTFGHLRWTAMWTRTIGTEVFTQLQSDEFLRLKLRVLAGGTVRVQFEPVEELLEIAMATGAMMEREVLNIDSDNSHARQSVQARSTSYLTLRLQLAPTLALLSTTYYQPRFTDFHDFRLLEEAALDLSVTDHLSLVVAFSLAHDSKPPDGVEQTDLVISPKLKVKW